MANQNGPPEGNKNPDEFTASPGFDHSLGEMSNTESGNASIASPIPQDKYEARLNAVMPMREPPELRVLRCRLLKAIDASIMRLSNPWRGGRVADLDRMILNIASEHAFKLLGTATLQEAVNLCLRLRMCATMIERMEAGDGN